MPARTETLLARRSSCSKLQTEILTQARGFSIEIVHKCYFGFVGLPLGNT